MLNRGRSQTKSHLHIASKESAFITIEDKFKSKFDYGHVL